MKIAFAQFDPTVGDLTRNYQIMLNFAHEAKELGAKLIIFPELGLLGYPPKDLILRKDFLDSLPHFHQKMADEAPIASIIGSVIQRPAPHLPHNAALLCHEGQVSIAGLKILLPNYNVFDELRYFSSPDEKACQVIEFDGKKLLISICEDAWNSVATYQGLKYTFDPIALAVKKHGPVDFIINIQASPFSHNKPKARELIFTNLAKTHGCTVISVGQVGANDQLLFDGHSMVINNRGQIIKRAKSCTTELVVIDQELPEEPLPRDDSELLKDVLVMGIRDYIDKCQAPGVIIGLSGGIDSAVCLVLSVLALGKDRVRAVFLPSKFSSKRSHDDAKKLADNLGIFLEVFGIEEATQKLRDLLGPELSKHSPKLADLADQNLQSRLRGLIIMALSNASNYLMLAPANKSELSVGYSTIYGDMCGAFSPIGDLYKGEVYRLAHLLNRHEVTIPDEILERAPTAELKPDQKDSDNLPDYEVLDQILYNFIDLEKSAAEIACITGFEKRLIDEVIGMVNRSEYKRRQGPFPLMVSDKVFGDARRLPIAKRL